jgi:hypothetical protein
MRLVDECHVFDASLQISPLMEQVPGENTDGRMESLPWPPTLEAKDVVSRGVEKDEGKVKAGLVIELPGQQSSW